MPNTAENLKKYGINPRAESERLKKLTLGEQTAEFNQNLRAYRNEVVKDKAVSVPYYYYFGTDGGIYSDPSTKPIFDLQLQLDKRERDGLFAVGVNNALDLARVNPDCLVALYSPEGPAAFDGDKHNPFSEINYDYGQLFLMKYKEEEKRVNSLAIKIKGEGKDWLEQLLKVRFSKSNIADIEEIKSYIQTPVFLGDINYFFENQWWKNFLIYESKKEKYYLDQVLAIIKSNFSKNYELYTSEKDTENYYPVIPDRFSEEDVFNSYISVIHQFLMQNQEYTIALSGSCGGSTVTLNEVELILGIDQLRSNPFPQIFSGFSSVLRAFFNLDSDDWTKGSCVSCGKYTMVGRCRFCRTCE